MANILTGTHYDFSASGAWSCGNANITRTGTTTFFDGSPATIFTITALSANVVDYGSSGAVTSGQQWTFSVWAKRTSGSATFHFQLYDGTASYNSSTVTPTTSWALYTYTVTATHTGNWNLGQWALPFDATGSIAFYAPSLEQAASRQVGPVAPGNQILITDFNNAAWSKRAGLVISGSQTFLDGGTAPTFVLSSGDGAIWNTPASGGLIGGQIYTISVWAKATASSPTLSFKIWDGVSSTEATVGSLAGGTTTSTLTTSWQLVTFQLIAPRTSLYSAGDIEFHLQGGSAALYLPRVDAGTNRDDSLLTSDMSLWTPRAGTTCTIGVAAPDGTNSAFSFATTSGDGYVWNGGLGSALVSGQVYTMSIWARVVSGSTVNIGLGSYNGFGGTGAGNLGTLNSGWTYYTKQVTATMSGTGWEWDALEGAIGTVRAYWQPRIVLGTVASGYTEQPKTTASVSRIRKTAALQAQSSKSRVRKTSSATQASNSRVRNTALQTQSSKSRIRKTSSATQSSTSQLLSSNSTTQTQSSKSCVQNTAQQTQSSVSRIQKTAGLQTQPSTSRIQKTTPLTQASVSRVKKTGSATVSSRSRMARNVWTVSGGALNWNVTNAPGGAYFNAAMGFHGSSMVCDDLRPMIGSATSTTYTLAFWGLYEGQSVRALVRFADGSSAWVDWNLQTGAGDLASGSYVPGSVGYQQSIGSGWWNCQFDVSVGSSPIKWIEFITQNNDSVTTGDSSHYFCITNVRLIRSGSNLLPPGFQLVSQYYTGGGASPNLGSTSRIRKTVVRTASSTSHVHVRSAHTTTSASRIRTTWATWTVSKSRIFKPGNLRTTTATSHVTFRGTRTTTSTSRIKRTWTTGTISKSRLSKAGNVRTQASVSAVRSVNLLTTDQRNIRDWWTFTDAVSVTSPTCQGQSTTGLQTNIAGYGYASLTLPGLQAGTTYAFSVYQQRLTLTSGAAYTVEGLDAGGIELPGAWASASASISWTKVTIRWVQPADGSATIKLGAGYTQYDQVGFGLPDFYVVKDKTFQRQTSQSRVQNTAAQTVASKSAIRKVTLQTTASASSIRNTAPAKNQTSRSRIQASVQRTITSHSRLQKTAPPQTTTSQSTVVLRSAVTQTSQSRIAATTSRTATSKSSVRRTATQTQASASRVKQTTAQTTTSQSTLTAPLNKYLAVGGSTVLTSPDGTNWTSRTISGLSGASFCAWQTDRYIILAGLNAYVSTDGTTWSTAYSLPSGTIGLAYGKGLYVRMDNNGLVYSSPNLVTWTQRYNPNQTFPAAGTAIRFDGTSFAATFAASGAGSDSSSLLTSSDGISWGSSVGFQNGGWGSLCPTSHGWVAGSFDRFSSYYLWNNSGSWSSSGANSGSYGYQFTYASSKFYGLYWSGSQTAFYSGSSLGSLTTQNNAAAYNCSASIAYDGSVCLLAGSGGILTSTAPSGTFARTSTSSLSWVCAGSPVQVYTRTKTASSISRVRKTAPAKNQASKSSVQNTASAKNQASKSRIRQTVQKTQGTVSRIRQRVAQLVQSVARLRKTAPLQTQPAKSRLQNTAPVQNQTSKSRVRQTAPLQGQTSQSRLQARVSASTSSVARVQNTALRSQASRSAIQNTTVQQQIAQSRVSRTAGSQIASQSRIVATAAQHQSSASRLQATASWLIHSGSRLQASASQVISAIARVARRQAADQPSGSRVQVTTLAQQTGRAAVQNTTQQAITSVSYILNTVHCHQSSAARIQVTGPLQSQPSVASIQATLVRHQTSVSRIGHPATRHTGYDLYVPEQPRAMEVPADERQMTVPPPPVTPTKLLDHGTMWVPSQPREMLVNQFGNKY